MSPDNSLTKFALAAIVALSSAASFAQSGSNVTLYGLLDVGVVSMSGLAGGRQNNVASGIMSGSRWGIRGNEDLGGGYRAIVTLESRIEADTGTMSSRPSSGTQVPGRLIAGFPAPVQAAFAQGVGASLGVNLGNATFDRQAFVGLVTPVGAVLAGRQYTPAFEVGSRFDTMQSDSFLSPGQIASIPAGLENRANNAVAYRIQTGPWTGSAMLALGEVPGSSSAGNLWGAHVIYSASNFAVGFGHNARKTSDNLDGLQSTILGASVNVGAGKLFVSGLKIKEDNPGAGAALRAGLIPALTPAVGAPTAAALVGALVDRLKQDALLMHVGVQWPLGPGQLLVVLNKLNDKTAANADTTSYGAVYVYPLSKRTDISALIGRYDNDANAQAAPGGGGYLGGVTATPGTDSTAAALTLRHRF